MTETQTTETAEIASTRTFYRSDYARFARAIQRARHVKCDPYTAKDVISQANVTVLAQAVADIFADDSPDRFDASKFLAGTQLPAKPDYGQAEDEHLEAEYEDAVTGE